MLEIILRVLRAILWFPSRWFGQALLNVMVDEQLERENNKNWSRGFLEQKRSEADERTKSAERRSKRWGRP